MTVVLIRVRHREIGDPETEGPLEDGGRDWSHAAPTPRNSGSPQKLGEARKGPPPELPEGAQPC